MKPKKQYKGIPDIKLRILFNVLLSINFGTTSEFNEHLIQNNLVDDICYMTTVEEDHIIVNRSFEDGHQVIKAKMPCLITTLQGMNKPRYMEEIEGKDGRPGIIYNERFTNHVQFNIIAPEYRIAWNVMERFEDLLISYAETIRGNGIIEYFFFKQYKDDFYDSFRNTFTVLSLVYRVDTETLRVIFKENINDIIANQKNNN